MFKIAILDDDSQYCGVINDMMKKVCADLKYEVSVINFYNKSEFMDFMTENGACIDILVLDIQLGGVNGVNIASKINERFPNVKIIYITAYSKCAADISDTDFTYFLIKPINERKLRSALKKAKEAVDEENKHIIWYAHSGILSSLNANSIRYLESSAHDINIYMDNGERVVVSGRLNDFEAQLSQTNRFLRIHQSYLVNMDKITDISNTHVHLNGGKVLNISRNRHSLCKKVFYDFIGERLLNS